VYVDVASSLLASVRSICAALPETVEQKSWAGTRWRIRQRTIAELVAVDGPNGPVTVLTFHADPEELDALVAMGPPFMKAGWGKHVVWMLVDDATDWSEVAELLTESFCLMAPKKLAATVARP
jgi:hypothetical protein